MSMLCDFVHQVAQTKVNRLAQSDVTLVYHSLYDDGAQERRENELSVKILGSIPERWHR